MSDLEHIAPIVQRVLHHWSAGVWEYGTQFCTCDVCGARRVREARSTTYWTADGRFHDRAPPCKPAA